MTSRPQGDYEVDGQSCWFVSQERMEKGVEDNEFLDVGQHDAYMYGTTFSSVREVMAENKLCVIDCRPEVRFLFCSLKKSVYLIFVLGFENAPQFPRIPAFCDIS